MGRASLGKIQATAGFRSSLSRFRPFRDHGFAGETRIRLRTRSGASSATIAAVVPPYELPTRSHELIPTASRNPRTLSAADERRQSKFVPQSENPAPGMSGAKTVAFLARMGIAWRQLKEYPSRPCSNTTAGPEPARQNRTFSLPTRTQSSAGFRSSSACSGRIFPASYNFSSHVRILSEQISPLSLL